MMEIAKASYLFCKGTQTGIPVLRSHQKIVLNCTRKIAECDVIRAFEVTKRDAVCVLDVLNSLAFQAN